MNPLTKFWSLAESQQDSLALVSTSVQMNYRDLSDNVARFAGLLRKHGVAKGNVVAIQLQPELEAVLILAVTQLGAVSLSASKLILDSYANKIDFLISEDQTTFFRGRNRILFNQEFMQELGLVAKITEPEELNPDDLVRLSFSSGTTGIPKGIPFTASRIPLRTASAHRNWMQESPAMSLLGLDTITGIITLLWSVTSGNTFFISKTAAENLELIERYGIKALETSPARLKDLLVEAKPNQQTKLKQILVAGSLMTSTLAKSCETVFQIKPSYLYGSSEVGSATIGDFDPENNNRLGQLVSDVELEIVDDELKPTPIGEVGNIRYRKPGMPTEYWNSTSSLLNGFVDGWFYPGDRAHLSAENYLFLEGRNDDIVNAAGNKFNLLTLDQWLWSSGFFDEVASFTFTDEGELKVGIAFSCKNPPDPSILVERVQHFLPNLRITEFIRIDSLPRNKMDKVDRKELSELIEGKNA